MKSINKKEIAITFLRLASSGKVLEAYEKFIHPNFYHHNPYFRGDRESFLDAMKKSAVEFPNKTFEVLRALEDGDLVAVHGRVKLTSESPEIALMHVFRFEEDSIIEEWEVAQETPINVINENGIF